MFMINPPYVTQSNTTKQNLKLNITSIKWGFKLGHTTKGRKRHIISRNLLEQHISK